MLAEAENIQNLIQTDLKSRISGISGSQCALIYRTLSNADPSNQSPLLWRSFFQSAAQTRNHALAVRALSELAVREQQPQFAGIFSMALGHYLRFFALNLSEAIKAYIGASTKSWTFALSAVIALHRLHRSNPQFSDIPSFISTIRQRASLTTEPRASIEEKLRTLPEDAGLERTQALINLALSGLLEWGDVSHAMDWLETAASLAIKSRQLIDISTAIALAVPDSLPVISRISTLLNQALAWKELNLAASLFEHLPFSLPDSTLLTFSMLYAIRLHDKERAIFYLTQSAIHHPQFWIDAVQKQAWICMHAAEDVTFRTALFDCLDTTENSALKLDMLKMIEKFAKHHNTRTPLRLRNIRNLIDSRQSTKALKAIHSAIRDATHIDAFLLFDALFDLRAEILTPQATAFDAQLLHAADVLRKQTGASHQYTHFLNRFLNTIEFEGASSPDILSLKQGIEARIMYADDAPFNIDSLDITPNNTPILAACLELIRIGESSLAMRAFFEWYETEPEFEPALIVLNFLDLAIVPALPRSTMQVLEIIHGSPKPESYQIIALATVLAPDNSLWLDRLRKLLHMLPEITDIFLRYLPCLFSGNALCDIIINFCLHNMDQSVARTLLTDHFDACLIYDTLLVQVIQMSETNSQQQQILDKMDEAIATFFGDITQKNALYAKKYKTAEMIGDERSKMLCLRDILEATPDDSFATTELKKIDPEQLKPQSKILYYQLSILVESSPRKRLKYQLVLADLFVQSDQTNNAISLYHTIIDENPGMVDVRYKLINLLKSQENWKAAENILTELIANEPDTDTRFKALIELASIQDEQMKQPENALNTLLSALDTDPSRISSLHQKLCTLCEKNKSFNELIVKYEYFTTHAAEYVVRRTAVFLLANVYEDFIMEPKYACKVLDEFALGDGSVDPEYLYPVCRFYKEICNWDGYLKHAEQYLKVSDDGDRIAKTALRCAHLYSKNFNAPQEAANVLQCAIEADIHSAQLCIEIAEELLKLNQTDNAIYALCHASDLEPDNAKKATILLSTSQLLLEQNRLEDAAQMLHNALTLSPNIEQATPVAEKLITKASAKQNKDAFNSVCEDLVHASPVQEQTQLILQFALMLAKKFDDSESAKALLQNYSKRLTKLSLDQNIIFLQILTLIDQPLNAVQLAMDLLKTKTLSKEQEIKCLTELLSNAASLDDVETVKATTDAMLAIDPNDPNANFKLIELGYHSGHWDETAERIHNYMPYKQRLSSDNAMLMCYYYGEILHAANKEDEAVNALNDAILIQNDFRPAVDLKLTILIEQERWDEALPVFTQLLSLTDETDVLGAIHKRIAEIYHFYVIDPLKAIAEYEQALTLGGDVEDVPVRLLKLYLDTEQWEKASMAASLLASAQVSSERLKAEYLGILADIQLNHLKTTKEAADTAIQAFNLNPVSPEILETLANSLYILKEFEHISELYDCLCSLTEDDPDNARKQLLLLSKITGSLPECKDALYKAQDYIRAHGITTDLISEAGSMPPQTEAPQKPKRKRVNTAPRGLLDDLNTSDPQNEFSMPEDARKSDDAANESQTKPQTKTPSSAIKAVVRENILETPILSRHIQNEKPQHPAPGTASVKSSVIYPSITHRTSSKLNANHALETLSFTLDDIHILAKDASPFTLRCIDDILDIASAEHPEHECVPLPNSISDVTRQSLFSIVTSPLNPGLSRLVSTLATSKTSPILASADDFNIRPIDAVPEEFWKIFENLNSILKLENVVLAARPQEFDPVQPLLHTLCPTIFCDPIQFNTLSTKQWTARMAFALVLSRPENILSACMTPTAVHQILTESTSVLLPGRNTSSIPQETAELYKQTLEAVHFTPVTLPRITPSTLSIVKQHAQTSKKCAIQAALLLSQSLMDCLQILTEIDNLKFPTTLLTLKSAMKRSAAIKDLVLFAFSPNAQKLFERIYKP